MGTRFDALSQIEQVAVAEFVRAEYDRLVSLQPPTYMVRNAQADPKGWQDTLRELLAADSKRVQAIVEKRCEKPDFNGFTLIEMSIVLVIIGLIIGGVLVGQDLLRAAGVRATISQIDKYNTAVNTFVGKYGMMPGDMNAQTATSFGFTARGGIAGQGDANGQLQTWNGAGPSGLWQGGGETGLFWVDLSTANGLNLNLIDGSFSSATITVPGVQVTSSTMNSYLPAAKIGKGNYIYVGTFKDDGVNYYGISVPTTININGQMPSTPGLSVAQAFSIDTKIDDGFPLTGNVLAKYVNGATWTTTANGSPAVTADCFDSTTTAGAYAVTVNAGLATQCALSIKMQGGLGN